MRNLLKRCMNSFEGMIRRGWPLGSCKDRVKEYVSERGVKGNGLEWARRECMDKERWRSIYWDASRGSEALELLID